MKTYDTEARRTLCEFMKNNAERQFTAEELCAAVSHSAGKSTVYRLIARLCDEGEIRRIPRGGERLLPADDRGLLTILGADVHDIVIGVGPDGIAGN